MLSWQVDFKMGNTLPKPGMWTWPQQESLQDQPWKQEDMNMAVQYSNMEPSLMELSLGDGLGHGWTPLRWSIWTKKIPAGLKVCRTNPKYVVYLLLKFSFSWFSGPKLPRKLSYFTMAQTSQGTYAMGGSASRRSNPRNEVLQLDCPGDQISSCQCKQVGNLQIARREHVAFALPESYDICRL